MGWGRRFTFCCLVAFLGLWALGAEASYAPPPIAGYVTDTAGRLSPGEIATLNDKLASYRTCSSNHVAVFFPRSLEGNSIEDVAYATFNTWKIGETKKDNGVLLVLATNERKVRIETGKGVGGDLTDVDAAHILRDDVNPNLKKNRFFAAADLATTSIGKKLGGCGMSNASPVSVSLATPRPPGAWTATPESSLWYRVSFTLACTLFVAFAFFVHKHNRYGAVAGLVMASTIYALVTLLPRGDDGLDDMAILVPLGTVVTCFAFVVGLVSWLIARDEKKGPGRGSSGGSSSTSSGYESSSSDYSSSGGGGSDYSGGGGSSGGGGASDSY